MVQFLSEANRCHHEQRGYRRREDSDSRLRHLPDAVLLLAYLFACRITSVVKSTQTLP